MLRKILILNLVLIMTLLGSANINLRVTYHLAIQNKHIAENLLNNLASKNALTTTEKGYLGATKMLMAKYYFNPISKLNSFNEGRLCLNEAILTDNKNLELKYLRYACAINSPSFLQYHHYLTEDRKTLENSINTLTDTDLKKRIQNLLNIKS